MPQEISSTDETESFLEFLPELSIQNLQEALQQISETITVALSTVSNLGSDLSEENREEAQQVVLAVIILPQLAMAAIRRSK